MDKDNDWTKEKTRRWMKEHDKGVSLVFNRFAGKSVNPADPKDPVLEEMRHEAAMHYSTLRLIPAGAEAPRDPSKLTRITAELVDDGAGKWRIGNRFFRC